MGAVSSHRELVSSGMVFWIRAHAPPGKCIISQWLLCPRAGLLQGCRSWGGKDARSIPSPR